MWKPVTIVNVVAEIYKPLLEAMYLHKLMQEEEKEKKKNNSIYTE